MNCPIKSHENADLLLAYCARKLDSETAGLLERHMELCADCRAFRDGQRAVWNALDQWEAMPVSGDFDRRLYRRIERERKVSWVDRLFQPFRPLFVRPALPLAAACVVMVAGFLLEYPGRVTIDSNVTSDASRAQPAVVDVQPVEVEKTLDDLEMLHEFNAPARAPGKTSKSM